MELIIDYIGGNCPVQAEGTINGVPFYFRSRWEHWSMNIGHDPVGIALGEPGWHKRIKYGEKPSAGYMPLKMAEALIRQCAEEFLATKDLELPAPEKVMLLTGQETDIVQKGDL